MSGLNSHSLYTPDFQPVPVETVSKVNDILAANGLSDAAPSPSDPRFFGFDLAFLPHEGQQAVAEQLRNLGLAIGVNATSAPEEDPDPKLVAAAFAEELD